MTQFVEHLSNNYHHVTVSGSAQVRPGHLSAPGEGMPGLQGHALED